MTDGIKIPVSAELDPKKIEQGLDRAGGAFDDLSKQIDASISKVNELENAINRVNEATKRVSKTKLNPIDKNANKDLDEHTRRVKQLLQLTPGLRRRLEVTGQSGKSFNDWDWGQLYPNSMAREQSRANAYKYVTGSVPQFSSGGGSGSGSPPPSRGGGSGWGAAAGQIARAGIGASGSGGQMAVAGMRGFAAAGAAGLAGGLIGMAVGKAVGAIRERIGPAEQEGIGYDTLKRQIGDVGVSFNVLRESIRAAAGSFDATFDESQRLAAGFAKTANLNEQDYKQLGDETRNAGGFARSFGIDPNESGQFFAQMRQFKVTSNDQDSKRLALLIGEAVTKSGNTAKTDEFMQTIANFASQQTRMGLTSANAGGFAGMLAGLSGSGIPGLDVQGSANLLMRANSAISSGGGGEAGQFFMHRAIGSRLGMDPIQSMILREQGAFGSANQTFGAGSLYEKFADKFGMEYKHFGGAGDKNNLQSILEQLQQQYKGRPDLLINATSNLLRMNNSQAMALHAIDPSTLRGMNNRLSRLGIDPKNLSSTGFQSLSKIETGDAGTLKAVAASLRARRGADSLTADEASRLTAAEQSGDEGQLRDILTTLTSTREQEKTEGGETRKSIAGVENAITKMATLAVPLLNDMRTGIIFLAGDKGKVSTKDMQRAILGAENKDRIESINAKFETDIRANGVAMGKNRAERNRIFEEDRKKMFDGPNAKMTQEEHAKRIKPLLEENERLIKKDAEIREAHQKALDDEKKALEKSYEQIKAGTFGKEDPTTTGSISVGQSDGVAAVKQAVSQAASGGGGYNKSDPDAKNRAMKFFMAQGWTEKQAAGMVANLIAESSMNPKAVGDGGKAYGLAQWHPDRQREFKKLFGHDMRDGTEEEQLKFMHYELTQGNERAAGDRLRQAKTKGEAGAVVSSKFARPAAMYSEMRKRAAIAEGLSAAPDVSPMPEGARNNESIMFKHQVSINPFELTLRREQQGGYFAADKYVVPTKVSPPTPMQGGK